MKFILLLVLVPVALAQWSAPPPHRHHPVNGPLGDLFKNLTEEQKAQFLALLKENRGSTKGEFKKAIEGFVATLPEAVQEKVEEFEKKRKEFFEKQAEKVKSLSEEAQEVYKKLKAIAENDDLTKKEELDQARELFKSVDKKIIDEFKQAGVRLPNVGPHGHGHGHTGRPHHFTGRPGASRFRRHGTHGTGRPHRRHHHASTASPLE